MIVHQRPNNKNLTSTGNSSPFRSRSPQRNSSPGRNGSPKRNGSNERDGANRRLSYRLSERIIETPMEATEENLEFIHAGMKIKHAWVSQKGYYPDG